MRDLQKNTDTVTGVLLTTAGTAMQQVLQNDQCIFDNLMRLAPLHVDDKSDTTGIMLL